MRKIAPFDRNADDVLTRAGVLQELDKKKNKTKLAATLKGARSLCAPEPFDGDVVRVLSDALSGGDWCPELLREFIGKRRDVPAVWYDWVAGYALFKEEDDDDD